MGQYTSIIGLLVWGAILSVAGFIAASRERAQARRQANGTEHTTTR
jgi:hypothetical protein